MFTARITISFVRVSSMPLHLRPYVFIATLLCCFVLSISAYADSSRSDLKTRTLYIGVSFAIPPWVITETNSGIELDILQQAFEYSGYRVEPKYLSFSLAYSLFEAGKLDGVINAKESVLKTGFLSDPVVTFQNVAISLKNKNYPEEISPSFLHDKSVVAFQKASILLGDDFKKMTQVNTSYLEVAKQSLQINLLMIRNIDFIIMDKSIFGYYWRQAQSDTNLVRARSQLKQTVRFHEIFKPNHYRFVFKTKKVRDDFNAGLSKLRKHGQYDKIFERYSHLTKLYDTQKGHN